ncbi:MAG: L-2-hydroxyglutarate oxidase [Fuerstiella sp.]
MARYDFAILGGGIVGLATAWRLSQRYPDRKILLLEKESSLAKHQTGRNSGVIHSGIYYKPGSLRALNCRAGKAELEEFCEQHQIAWQKTGKVIVATKDSQLPALQTIFDRGQQNGVDCRIIDQDELGAIEPHAAGIKAIHVPESGIVDYPAVCETLGHLLTEFGADLQFSRKVTSLQQKTDVVQIGCSGDAFEARQVINCTGLHSDRIAKLAGQKMKEKIVPFRGEYYTLTKEAEHLCKGLIYPVPDPEFPFLGVHFTRMIEGGVECGPNAVLALAREGYTWKNVNLRDLAESMTYPGFLKLAFKYWQTGLGEIWRSVSRKAFVKALQHLVPEITTEHLVVAPAGVRAQALAPEGKLVDDFLILRHQRVLNVCNAPSPAATAALNIGRSISDQVTV